MTAGIEDYRNGIRNIGNCTRDKTTVVTPCEIDPDSVLVMLIPQIGRLLEALVVVDAED